MNYLRIKVMYVMLAVLGTVGYYLVSCTPEDVEPNNTPPVAGFTFTVDNDQHVPAYVVFTNTTVNGESYQWDFGNGLTSTDINPTTGYQEKGTYTVSLIASNAYGSDTTTAEITISGVKVNQEDIIGKWSIVEERIIVNNDTTELPQSLNEESLEFKADGTYQRISIFWLEWESGTYTLVGDTLNLHPLDGNDTYDDQSVWITSVSSSLINAEVNMEEDGTSIRILALLMRNTDSQGNISYQDLLGKWSVNNFDEFRYSFVSDMVGYRGDEVRVNNNLSSPDHNYYTINFKDNDSIQVIDNWQDGGAMMVNYQYLDDGDYWITTPESEVLFQISNVTDLDHINAKVIRFDEENDTTYRYVDYYNLTRNDGTEAAIIASELAGSWEVVAKSEDKNNVLLPTNEQHGPAVGTIVAFSSATIVNGYETGTVTPWENGVAADWRQLDDSNFYFTDPSGSDRLYHVSSYDADTHELDLYSLWFDGDGNRYELSLSLLKI